MLIDLQLHSTYSDGFLSPAEVAEFIAARGVKIAALTDHTTVGGLKEFKLACDKYKIKTVAGLELYVKSNSKKFSLLWFNFDDNNPELHDMLRNIQIRRRGQARRALEKLVSQNFKIEVDKTIDKYNHYVPINRITRDIYDIKHNRNKINKLLGTKNPREEEIIKILFFNKKGPVLRESYIDIKRVISLRKKMGGQLILNHPAKYSYVKKEFLEKLKKLGVDGVEVLSPHHSLGAVMYLQCMAEKLNFITSGGSDFHLRESNNCPLQNSWDYFKIDSRFLPGVEKIIG